MTLKEEDVNTNKVNIEAVVEDKIVEAFSIKGVTYGFGVKWHPELLLNDKVIKNIFKKFVQYL